MLAKLFPSGTGCQHGDAHAVVPHLPAAHSLGEVGYMGAAENAVHKWTSDSKPENRIYFAVIMTVDPFPFIYSGHLDASRRR